MLVNGIDITLQEVPGEIALSFAISGCGRACVGCHSPELQTRTGVSLSFDLLDRYIATYKSYITCILFLGGEWEESFSTCLIHCKDRGLKTCLYTAEDELNPHILTYLNYVKYGAYDQALGNLTSKTTNQRFIDIKHKKDLTHLFQRES
jgi:anaerobic ribonucleoside-triphosphate reductase activating protein